MLAYDHATHYSYDIHGNVRTLVQDHPHLEEDACPPPPAPCTSYISQRHKRIDYSYDLISGNVKQVVYQKDQPDEFNHAYTYDADNRITEVETSADGENWHTDAKYFYYAHGPLQRVELGEHIVQGTDYAYTLQGWLKGVNSERLQPGNDMGHDGDLADADPDNDLIGRDAFGFALGYYGDGDFAAITTAWTSAPGERAFAPIGTTGTRAAELKPLYNGNIATTTYTLEPFGNGSAGWDAGHTEGQVLAQVYTYDQLNRLKKARGVIGLGSTNTWDGVNDGTANRYRSEYEYDANGNITTADRWDNDGNHYDQFTYKYQKRNGRMVRNRLYELYDDADAVDAFVNEMGGAQDIPYNQTITNTSDPAYFHEEDPALNGLHNYHYDALGNLIHDEREQIDAIEWTVAGKVKSVTRTTGSTREPLSFGYGASGQRIMKEVGVNPGTGYREHYIRDAQGNIMATYRYTNTGPASLKLGDRPVYGSSRLGTYGQEVELHSLQNWDPADPVLMDAVALHYELTDHLGNVCAVVTGRLMDGNGGGTLKQAELVSAQGYEPFGALLPGRNFSSDSYRYLFQGQEKDDEMHGATGTSYAYKYRMHDARIGRFLSIDPLAAKYPHNSPYAFSENRVIDGVELEGAEYNSFRNLWTVSFGLQYNRSGLSLLAGASAMTGGQEPRKERLVTSALVRLTTELELNFTGGIGLLINTDTQGQQRLPTSQLIHPDLPAVVNDYTSSYQIGGHYSTSTSGNRSAGASLALKMAGNLSGSIYGDLKLPVRGEATFAGGGGALAFTPNSPIGSFTFSNPLGTVPLEYGDRAVSLRYQYNSGKRGGTSSLALGGSLGTLQALGMASGNDVQFGSYTGASTTSPTFMSDFGFSSGQNVNFELNYSLGTGTRRDSGIGFGVSASGQSYNEF